MALHYLYLTGNPLRVATTNRENETIVLLLVVLRRNDSSTADRIALYWSSGCTIYERIFLSRMYGLTSISLL